MERPVNRVAVSPLPVVNVIYSPPSQVLFIENGQSSAVGETIAGSLVVFYDKDADDTRGNVVAIRIDRAEWVLKPFVDAILTKHGVNPRSDPKLDNRVIKRVRAMPVSGPASQVELEPESLPDVTYSPSSGTLLIENGEPSAVGESIAKNLDVYYDKDVEDAWSSAVAIRIDRAEHVLKPFVDAIFAKYGIKPDQEPVGTETIVRGE